MSKFTKFFLYGREYSQKFHKFYFKIALNLMPRYYYKNEVIYSQYEEVEEMYLICEGKIGIGISLISNKLRYYKEILSNDYIGDYYCIFNQKSNYNYIALDETKTFGINKEDLIDALNIYKEIKEILINRSYQRYKEKFYNPIKKLLETDCNLLYHNDNFVNYEQITNSMKDISDYKPYNIDYILEDQINKYEDNIKRIETEIEQMLININTNYKEASLFTEQTYKELELKLEKNKTNLEKTIKVLNDLKINTNIEK